MSLCKDNVFLDTSLDTCDTCDTTYSSKGKWKSFELMSQNHDNDCFYLSISVLLIKLSTISRIMYLKFNFWNDLIVILNCTFLTFILFFSIEKTNQKAYFFSSMENSLNFKCLFVTKKSNYI